MNFLAHYFLLNQNENPLTVFGNLLPDIYPNFTKFYNSILKNQSQFFHYNEHIVRGINFHLATDNVFHTHLLFTENYEFAKIQLNNIGVNKKAYAIAHILVELLIDRQILLNNKQVAISFYDKLIQVDLESVTDFLKIDSNSDNFQLFLVNFISFIKNRYAFKLNDIENIPIALENILQNRIDFNTNFNNKEFTNVVANVEKNILINLFEKLENIKLQIEI